MAREFASYAFQDLSRKKIKKDAAQYEGVDNATLIGFDEANFQAFDRLSHTVPVYHDFHFGQEGELLRHDQANAGIGQVERAGRHGQRSLASENGERPILHRCPIPKCIDYRDWLALVPAN